MIVHFTLLELAILELAKNPKFQSILQRKMKEFNLKAPYESLPLPIKHRVRALKNIQVEQTALEAQFYEEVQKLEAKYQLLYQPLLDKRQQIVTGLYQPTPEESRWEDSEDEDEDDEDDDTKPLQDKPQKQDGINGETPDDSAKDDVTENGACKSDDSAAGIPEFWLTALKNVDLFTDYIMEHDEPILKHLTDIKLSYTDSKGMDFTLDFYFSDNEYFSNKVLTKTYKLSCEVPKDDPFSFEGATITQMNGCKIDWKKGKNVTVKTIKKKQKHKGKGQSRVITKTVPNESFFNFFCPPDPDTFGSKDEEEAEELALQLDGDITRAEFLRDRLIPKAVLFFTGDALDDEDDEDDDMGLEDDDDDNDESDPDDDYNPQSDLQNSKPPECKNQ